jgi:hypothetical protein
VGGLSFWGPSLPIYADACRSSEEFVLDPPAAASVDDVANELAALPGGETSSVEDVTVNEFDGKYIELTAPCGADVRYWVLDVDGVRLVMIAHVWPEFQSEVYRTELQGIVDSVRITAPSS